MKYDLTRCNNLNFKLGNGTTGFIKIPPEGNCYLYMHDETWDGKSMMQKPRFWRCVAPEVFNRFVEENELLIVPRDPETYTEWKVGDKVIGKTGKKVYTIIAVLGRAAVVSLDSDVYIVGLATFEGLTKYNNLVLTDYEIELLASSKEKKECPFKKGDKVLVRDSNDSNWIPEIFDEYCDNDTDYHYGCEGMVYAQCIPYNEKTWQLLGTTDDYKEEE